MINLKKLFLTCTVVLLGLSAQSGFADNSKLRALFADKKSQPPVTAMIVANRTAGTPKSAYEVGILLKHASGWHTYWKNPGSNGFAISVEWKLPRHWSITPVGWPLPQKFVDGSVTSFGYTGQILLPYRLEIPWGTPYETFATIRANVKWLACKSNCVPGEAELKFSVPIKVRSEKNVYSGLFERTHHMIPEDVAQTPIHATLTDKNLTIEFPTSAGFIGQKVDFYPLDPKTIDLKKPGIVKKNDDVTTLSLTAHPDLIANPGPLKGIVVADDGPGKKGWAIQTTIPLEMGSASSVTVALDDFQETATATPLNDPENIARVNIIEEGKQILNISSATLFAFLGGLILNLMPCVFPVLSLKILHLIDNSHRKGSLAVHGLMFGFGVIVSVLVLAALLQTLRSIGYSVGWGFQLQSPWVVALLVLLFFVIALNLLGVFEFTAASHLADSRAAKALPVTGYGGSFSTGILTVLVASPCTAPFMGAALGYAVTQESMETLAVFFTLGLGIALPWVILTIFPVWTHFLPKPGPWMMTLRRIMAIPMFVATLWLLWVLSYQLNLYGLITVIVAATVTAVFLWALRRKQYGRGNALLLRVVSLVIASVCVGLIGSHQFDEQKHLAPSTWMPWSMQAVKEAVVEQNPVIVDFTAAWCVTCQYNKATALYTKNTDEVLKQYNYKRFVADWTNRNPAITKTLNSFGRTGVPLYLLYNGTGQVTVLPEILTEAKLIRALKNNAQTTR